jgi:predicted ATPase
MESVSDTAHDGGVWVCLASIRDPELVLPTIAQALDVPDVTGQSLLRQVGAALAERRLLLVLDNLEHLLNPTAPLLAALLTTCPGLTVLATSRARLEISGERVMPLPPLDPETARTLFVQRAQAADPGFNITTENAPVIAAICDRLDRLPLAIELAAARVNVLPLPALLARLDHRLDLLTGGPRDAPDRQRDMRAAISWSHDLLSEPEQVVFRRLGVFVGGFTLDAAEVVADEDANVLASVSALVASSLVTPVEGARDEPRFTMFETIREYALEQLIASGESQLSAAPCASSRESRRVHLGAAGRATEGNRILAPAAGDRQYPVGPGVGARARPNHCSPAGLGHSWISGLGPSHLPKGNPGSSGP